MARVDLLEPLLANHRERLLERQHQAHRRRERRLAERGALARLAQVEVEARQPLALDRRRRPTARGSAWRCRAGTIRPFWEPHTTTSTPHASCGSGWTPRLVIASTTSRTPRARVMLRDRLDVVDRAGRGLAVGREHRRDRGVALQRALDRGRVDRRAPLDVDRLVRDAVGLEQDRSSARRTCRPTTTSALSPGCHQVDDRGLHRSGAGGGEQEHLALGAVQLSAASSMHAPQRGAEHLGAVVRRHLGERAQDAGAESRPGPA